MVDNFSSYMNMPNHSLSLALHCRLKEFYAYKKACDFVVSYLDALNFVGFVDVSIKKSEETVSKLETLAKIRMVKCDVTEESVSLSIDNVVGVLREIEYNYIARIKALGYDPFYGEKNVDERIDEIKCYFDDLVKGLKKEDLILKREKN